MFQSWRLDPQMITKTRPKDQGAVIPLFSGVPWPHFFINTVFTTWL